MQRYAGYCARRAASEQLGLATCKRCSSSSLVVRAFTMRVQVPQRTCKPCKPPRAFGASHRHVRVHAASTDDLTPEQKAEMEQKMKDPEVRLAYPHARSSSRHAGVLIAARSSFVLA